MIIIIICNLSKKLSNRVIPLSHFCGCSVPLSGNDDSGLNNLLHFISSMHRSYISHVGLFVLCRWWSLPPSLIHVFVSYLCYNPWFWFSSWNFQHQILHRSRQMVHPTGLPSEILAALHSQTNCTKERSGRSEQLIWSMNKTQNNL